MKDILLRAGILIKDASSSCLLISMEKLITVDPPTVDKLGQSRRFITSILGE